MLNQNTPMFLTYHPMSYRQVPYVLNKIKNIKAHRDSSISGPPRGGNVLVYEDGGTITPLKTLKHEDRQFGKRSLEQNIKHIMSSNRSVLVMLKIKLQIKLAAEDIKNTRNQTLEFIKRNSN